MLNKNGQTRLDKGKATIYLLPNLVTTAALLCGFYALYVGFQAQYMEAAIAIILAAILDAVDGRLARYTKSTTLFGAQYDNLSDMVAFGVAPAMLVLHAGMMPLGNTGWIVAFIYTACTALRLARYASQPDNLKSFTGLASPAAGIMVAVFVWMSGGTTAIALFGVELKMGEIAAGLVAMLGLLMISNFRYWSPKHLSLRSKISFMAMVVLVFSFALIALAPATTLFTLFAVYVGSGPVMALYRLVRSITVRTVQPPGSVYVMHQTKADDVSSNSNKPGA